MSRCKWEWHPRGWFVLLTIGGTFGLGFMWRAMRYSDVDIYFGPIWLTVQPPMPAAIEWTDPPQTPAGM